MPRHPGCVRGLVCVLAFELSRVCAAFAAATDGVVVVTEKKVPSILIDETSFQRTALLADNIGVFLPHVLQLMPCAHAAPSSGVIYSGMGPDFRVLVRKGQKKAIQYYLTFKVSWEGRGFVCTPFWLTLQSL